MDKDGKLSMFLKGISVKADHPITCLNPDLEFTIFEARIEDGSLYCRGEKTMWFHFTLLTRV